MNKIEKIKNTARSLAEAMIDGDTREWPPECPFILYQPERPAKQQQHEENNIICEE